MGSKPEFCRADQRLRRRLAMPTPIRPRPTMPSMPGSGTAVLPPPPVVVPPDVVPPEVVPPEVVPPVEVQSMWPQPQEWVWAAVMVPVLDEG